MVLYIVFEKICVNSCYRSLFFGLSELLASAVGCRSLSDSLTAGRSVFWSAQLTASLEIVMGVQCFHMKSTAGHIRLSLFHYLTLLLRHITHPTNHLCNISRSYLPSTIHHQTSNHSPPTFNLQPSTFSFKHPPSTTHPSPSINHQSTNRRPSAFWRLELCSLSYYHTIKPFFSPIRITPPTMASAAARVLGTAELLENILLHITNIKSARTRSTPQPVIQLFLLKRVSSTFNLNIRHSKKLARLMFLAKPQAVYVPDINNGWRRIQQEFAPVLWFLDCLKISTDAMDGVDTILWRDHSDAGWTVWGSDCKHLFGREYIATQADSSASWRDIIASASVSISDEAMTGSFRLRTSVACQTGGQQYQTGMYRIEAGETLGSFFDKFVEARKALYDIVWGQD